MFDRIATDNEQFKQVLRLRYELLDMPVGAPEISVPSENDNNPKNSNFVAIDSKQVVSAARLDRVTDTEFVVRRMVTSPEYQRKGIGRSIMRLMLFWLVVLTVLVLHLFIILLAVILFKQLQPTLLILIDCFVSILTSPPPLS